jgi:hypothetical protein
MQMLEVSKPTHNVIKTFWCPGQILDRQTANTKNHYIYTRVNTAKRIPVIPR